MRINRYDFANLILVNKQDTLSAWCMFWILFHKMIKWKAKAKNEQRTESLAENSCNLTYQMLCCTFLSEYPHTHPEFQSNPRALTHFASE